MAQIYLANSSRDSDDDEVDDNVLVRIHQSESKDGDKIEAVRIHESESKDGDKIEFC